jgi:N-acetylglucosamine-6-phosphate deacetylase
MIRVAIAAKGTDRIMAVTDGTAASGLAEGGAASLGGRRICVRDGAAYLDDGTLAGSVATMDRVFRFLVRRVGLSPSEASQLCSTTLLLRSDFTIAASSSKALSPTWSCSMESWP